MAKIKVLLYLLSAADESEQAWPVHGLKALNGFKAIALKEI